MADSEWRQMGGNRTCDNCKIHSAEVYCECSGGQIYLCGNCIGDHTTVKYCNLMHQFIPASIDIANAAAYKQRSEGFAKGCAELKDNLARVDQCCREVTDAYNAVIESLGQWRDYYVKELKAWKETLSVEITEAENEVKSTLAQDFVQLRGKYSSLLRYYQPGTLQLFSYQIDTTAIQNLVKDVTKFQYVEIPNAESFARPIVFKSKLKL